MRSLIILCLIFTALSSFSQTCIIGYRTDAGIVVGADSKATSWIYAKGKDGKSQSKKSEYITCKIEKAGNYYFAISGVGGEDSRTAARESCLSHQYLRGVVADFLNKRKAQLTIYLETLRLNNRQEYLEQYDKKEVLGMLFWTIEGSVPKLDYLAFRIVNKINEPVNITVSDTFYDQGTYVVLVGTHKSIDKLSEPTLQWKTEPVDAVISRLIKIQSRNTPETVDSLISIVQTTYSGSIWIAKQGCN